MDNSFKFTGILLVYVLELEDDCYYVGISTHLNFRLGQHLDGTGAKWTKLHKVKGIKEVRFGNRKIEDLVTKEYISMYGEDKVKGGSWCRVNKKIKIEWWLRQITI
jgi:predicted GIY-YIG superfamily endonuclease